MSFFSGKTYTAENVKKMIQPSLDLTKEVMNQIEQFDAESETWVDELEKMMSNIYLYMGVSYTQASDLGKLLSERRISLAAMSAANKTFMHCYSELDKCAQVINETLRRSGYLHADAIDFHEHCWQKAMDKKPIEMDTLQRSQPNKAQWSWINEDSWLTLIDSPFSVDVEDFK
jgi:hypothetical protein